MALKDAAFTERIAHYFVTVLRKAFKNFSWGTTSFNEQILKNVPLSLPVTETGEPDFALMERLIAELEARHIAELEAYLEACGLQDTRLSLQEEQALAIFSKTASQPQPHKTFRLGDLFTVATPKRKFNANAVKVGGIHPYVVRTSKDNGQRGSILADEQWLNPGSTIAFGQDTATVFYQPKPYFTGDKIKVMALRGAELSEQVAHYLVTVLRAAFVNFSWGTTSFNEHVLKEMPLQLPITAEGEPDYAAMATLISAVEKRVIDRLSAWRKREREATARCITS